MAVHLLGGPAALSADVAAQVRSRLSVSGSSAGTQQAAQATSSAGGGLSREAGIALGSLALLPFAAIVGRRRRRD